ncbi:MAG: GNAT family N-acetyltransferase, partial [Candidatus Heimdallarchaeota archaeon]
MRFYKKIIGEKCYLSPISEEDAEKWAEWFTDLEVTIPLGDEALTPTSVSKERKTITDLIQSGA